jgi:hypothetical protein
MNRYPKILSVKALADKKLEVLFEGDVTKVYDCIPLLKEEPFISLSDDILFRNVRPDLGGYAVIWNDVVDLSESEIWENGRSLPT